MNLVIYYPPAAGLDGIMDALKAALKGFHVIDASGKPGIADAMKDGFAKAGRSPVAVLNPPCSAEETASLDRAFEDRFGRKGLPRAVFFAPPRPWTGTDAHAEYRDRVRPAFERFHAARRSFEFRKPEVRFALKAVRLARKSKSLIRWGALLPAAVAAAAVLAGVFLFRDRIIRPIALERIQTLFGAKVEAGSLATTLLPSVRIDDVKVADRRKPMQNLFEFENLSAGVDAAELASGRVRVKELKLEGLRFATARAESGSLDGDAGGGGMQAGPAEEVEKGVFETALDSALAKVIEKLTPPKLDELETVKEANAIRKECEDRYAAILKRVGDFDLKGRLERTKALIEGLAKRQEPASVSAFKASAGEFKSLKLGTADLEAAQKAVASALGVNLDEEKRKIVFIRRDLDDVKKSLTDAGEILKRSRNIQKVTLKDIPAVLSLIKDLEALDKKISTARTRLESAVKGVAEAASGLEGRATAFAGSVSSSESAIKTAREVLEKTGGQVAAAYESLSKALGTAKDDFEKEKAEVLGALEKISTEAGEAVAFAADLRKSFEESLRYLLTLDERIIKALEADKDNLMSRYGVADFDTEELIKSVLGEGVSGWMDQAYSAYLSLKPHMHRKKRAAGPVKAAVEKGHVYDFPAPEGPVPPAFWAESVRFSGIFPVQGSEFALEGTVTDLATDVDYTGKPVVMEFKVSKDGKTISGRFEYHPSGRMVARIEASGFPLSGIKFRGKYAPREISADSLGFTLEFSLDGGAKKAAGRLSVKGLRFTLDFAGADARIAAIIGKILGGVRDLNVDVAIAFRGTSLESFSTRTDLGDSLRRGFREALAEQVEEAKKKGLMMIEKEAGPHSKLAREAISLFSSNGSSMLGSLEAGTSACGGEAASSKEGWAERLRGLEGLLEAVSDPSGASKEQTAELDGLEQKLATAAAAFAKDRTDRGAALDGLSKDASGQNAGVEQLAKDLKAELSRLQGLVKKMK